MRSIKNIIYRAVGFGKNEARRVWLEGECLEVAGLKVGDSYSVDYNVDLNRVVVSADPFGPRIVTGKSDRQKHTPDFHSLIDLCNLRIKSIFGHVENPLCF